MPRKKRPGDEGAANEVAAGVLEHPDGRRLTVSMGCRSRDVTLKREGGDGTARRCETIQERTQLRMWLRAKSVIAEKLAEGFRIVERGSLLHRGDGTADGEDDEADDAPPGRFSEPAWAGLLDPERSGTPHSSFERRLETVYDGARFPLCRHPPLHLLTLDLGAVATFPESVRALGQLPIVYAHCEGDCWMLAANGFDAEAQFALGRDGRVKPIARKKAKRSEVDLGEAREVDDPEDEWPSCGSARPVEQPTSGVWLAPAVDFTNPPFLVGGKPRWCQDGGDWPDCATCRKALFFVAQVFAIQLGCGDQWLYAFVCEKCRTTAITMQCT